MTDAISDFIQRAQLLPVSVAVSRLGLKLPKKIDAGMPCPRCGGRDRFAVNTAKGLWNCRHCGLGGRNGLGLVGHVRGYDLHRRGDLLEACALLLCEAIPEGGERETAEDKAAREARLQAAMADAAADEAKREREQNAFREREVKQARGVYFNARVAIGEACGDDLRTYLYRRTGFAMPDGVFENIRVQERLTYWHGQDERGNPVSLYVGYAMVAPFVDLDGHVTGCHQTWIDLTCAPKYRPVIGRDEKGNALPTKKMRGTKKGSVIPVLGDLAAARWVGAEGIETVAAFAGFEGFRADTFYFATGDLGNLAGPADPASAFAHPDLKTLDSRGHSRAARVPGAVPRADQTAADAYQVPGHVVELIHLADGDSEPVFTAAAMKRAENRLERDGLSILTIWPPSGIDFAVLGAEAGA